MSTVLSVRRLTSNIESARHPSICGLMIEDHFFAPPDRSMTPNAAYGFLLLALVLSACTAPGEPLPITPAGDAEGAAVVRRALPRPAVPPLASVGPIAPALPPREPPVAVPAGSIYVCVSDTGGVRQQTSIQFAPKVAALCAKHPEMGPCQYERDICRRSGGRVYAAGGIEITPQTEAEYDKKVMRVRFKAN
jgi:hypothetical protein